MRSPLRASLVGLRSPFGPRALSILSTAEAELVYGGAALTFGGAYLVYSGG